MPGHKTSLGGYLPAKENFSGMPPAVSVRPNLLAQWNECKRKSGFGLWITLERSRIKWHRHSCLCDFVNRTGERRIKSQSQNPHRQECLCHFQPQTRANCTGSPGGVIFSPQKKQAVPCFLCFRAGRFANVAAEAPKNCRSEEAKNLSGLNRRGILRFAQNDKIMTFPRH